MLTPVIGIDLMGGDFPPETLFENLLDFFRERPQKVRLVFYLPQALIDQLKPLSKKNLPDDLEISFVEAKEVIQMEDDPLLAIRSKKNASIPLGIQDLSKKKLNAFVSLGNTGALIGASKVTLKTLEGIQRPALLALLPTKIRPLAVLDVGANVSCSAKHLTQFALMGVAYQKCLGIENPKVGLLNIGSEKRKGRSELVQAYQQLQQLNEENPSKPFLGNIEGKEAFLGHVNVLVTEGFSGNIFLKTAEGMTAYILERILDEGLDKHKESSFSSLARDLNYAEYPGALICGINSVVIKCHGYSNGKALYSSILGAINLVSTGFIEKLKEKLSLDL